MVKPCDEFARREYRYRDPGWGDAQSRFACHGDFERVADLTHPLVAESAQALHERSERHALDRVEVDGRGPRYRILARLEQDLALDPTNRGRARADQRPFMGMVVESADAPARCLNDGGMNDTA
jgi:hypothetical protein